MTVIEALEWLCDEGRYVAFRANCREFTCGSCAMLINGKPALACDTLLADNMRLEPLTRYPVKRDLVVDTSAVREQWKKLELWPQEKDSKPLDHVPASSLEGWHRAYARCIECYVCLDACPASDTESSRFAGPMWMLQIARARSHPRDRANRLDQAAAQGVGRCVSCFECANVCPVEISPIFEIQGLRWSLLVDRTKLWLSKIGLARPPREEKR
jgi:succinate dehydrogenase / fumarate reductase iron-sulfur subunit